MPPTFISEVESLATVPKSTIHFKSVFEGTPPFSVKWFKGDSEIMSGPSQLIGVEGNSCFLDLYSVGPLQNGIYSCQVSNDAGTVKCAANLVVKGERTTSTILFHCCVICLSLPV